MSRLSMNQGPKYARTHDSITYFKADFDLGIIVRYQKRPSPASRARRGMDSHDEVNAD